MSLAKSDVLAHLLSVIVLTFPCAAVAQYTGTVNGSWDTTKPGGPGYQQGINAYGYGGGSGVPASYDVKIGDVYLRAGAGVVFSYNDNISLKSEDEDSDFIISPNARIGYYLPLTRENGMQLSLDFGAQFYMNHDEYNNFTLFPNGDNAFEIYAQSDNWSYRLRDTFHFYSSPLVSYRSTGSEDVRQFMNATILTADADYNQFLTGAGYTHVINKYWGDDYDYLDRQTDMLNAYFGVRVSSPVIVGVNAGLNYDYYESDKLNDGLGVNGSVYTQFVLSRNISGGASVGWGWTRYEEGGAFEDRDDFSDLIFSFVLTHEVNKYFRHSLNVFKNVQPGVTSNYQDTINLIYNIGWDLMRFWTLDLVYNFTYYDTSSSDVSETATLHRLTLGNSWQLTKNVNLTMQYTLQLKESDIEVDFDDWDIDAQNFSQNVFSVGLQYLF